MPPPVMNFVTILNHALHLYEQGCPKVRSFASHAVAREGWALRPHDARVKWAYRIGAGVRAASVVPSAPSAPRWCSPSTVIALCAPRESWCLSVVSPSPAHDTLCDTVLLVLVPLPDWPRCTPSSSMASFSSSRVTWRRCPQVLLCAYLPRSLAPGFGGRVPRGCVLGCTSF
jgi:hypothetical protein